MNLLLLQALQYKNLKIKIQMKMNNQCLFLLSQVTKMTQLQSPGAHQHYHQHQLLEADSRPTNQGVSIFNFEKHPNSQPHVFYCIFGCTYKLQNINYIEDFNDKNPKKFKKIKILKILQTNRPLSNLLTAWPTNIRL